jgi:hypothetical protein
VSEADARRRRIEAMFSSTPIAAPTIVPGGYPVALLDRVEQGDEAALQELSTFLRDGACELFRRGRGSMHATAYVFCRCDPVGGDARDPLYTTSITSGDAHDSEAVKSTFTSLVHGIAMIGQARGVAFFFEAWAVSGVAERPRGSLEFVPGRKEIVMVTLETQSTHYAWTGEVTRHGRRGFVIAPFQRHPAEHYGGRFCGLMKPGYDAAVAAKPDEP